MPASLGPVDQALDPISEVGASWKSLLGDPDLDQKLRNHFACLAASDSPGARLAMAYLIESSRIAQELISEGIAKSSEDINTVLITGFHHLYGPINEYTAS